MIEELLDGKLKDNFPPLLSASALIRFDTTEKLNEDALAQPGKALNQKALKMYAVKSDFDTMLDVARGASYRCNRD